MKINCTARQAFLDSGNYKKQCPFFALAFAYGHFLAIDEAGRLRLLSNNLTFVTLHGMKSLC